MDDFFDFCLEFGAWAVFAFAAVLFSPIWVPLYAIYRLSGWHSTQVHHGP